MRQNETVQVIIPKKGPQVSVIIPSLDGYRNGNVPGLIQAIKQQTFKDLELIIVKGVKPCARAHNEGVKHAHGDIIVFFDDDITLGHEKVIESLVAPFREGAERSTLNAQRSSGPIGITGASQLIPPEANWFQKRFAQEITRFQSPIVSEQIESDMATHAAMAIRKKVFIEIGGENENLIYGDDPDLRARVRQAGYKIVLVPDTWVYHPPPRNLSAYLRLAFQRGKGAAHDFYHYPDSVYETPPDNLTEFVPQRRFVYRVARAFGQTLCSLVNLRFIFLFIRLSYGLGYVYGLLCEVLKLGKR